MSIAEIIEAMKNVNAGEFNLLDADQRERWLDQLDSFEQDEDAEE